MAFLYPMANRLRLATGLDESELLPGRPEPTPLTLGLQDLVRLRGGGIGVGVLLKALAKRLG